MRSGSLACRLLPLLVVLSGEPARAADAGALFDQAIVQYDRRHHEQSLALLDEAVASTREKGLLGRIHLYRGINLFLLEDEEGARAAFALALDNDPQLGLDPDAFERPLVELYRKVARSITGTLSVVSDWKQAEVLVDGTSIGRTPINVAFPVGYHLIEVRDPRGKAQPYREEIVLHTSASHQVRAEFGTVLGWLTVHASPAGAEVLIDRVLKGNAPLNRIAISSGKHEVSVRAPGHTQETRTVTVSPDVELNLTVDLVRPAPPAEEPARETPPRSPRIWTWVAAGASLVSTVGALTFGALAWGDHNQRQILINNNPSPLPGSAQKESEQLRSSGETKQVAANVFWVTTGVTAVAAVVLFVVEGAPGGE